MLADLKKGSALWIRLDGVSLGNIPAHSAFCQTLTRAGFGVERGGEKPELVVLDWSRVAFCGAEGFALFSVLATKLTSHGIRAIVCEPESAAIHRFLIDSGMHDLHAPVEWIANAHAGRRSLKCLAPSALFSVSDTEMVELFLDDLSSFIRTTSLSRDCLNLLMATAHEVIQNVLSHSSAEFGAAVALLAGRKGAACVQLGVADDGVGIASSIATHPEHSWLSGFTDSSVTETVLNQKLSRRPQSLGASSDERDLPQPSSTTKSGPSADAGSGGGMGRLIRRLLEQDGVAIRIRTGTAFVNLRGEWRDQYRKKDLTFGAGTQFLLQMDLPP